MSRFEKALIACGAVIIVLMMVVVAFALGVYVGRRGWGALGQLVQPGQPLMPPPAFPQPQLQPHERPNLVGEVRFVSANTITIRTPQGLRMVSVDAETQIRGFGPQEEATLEDIKPGTVIAVSGEWEPGNKTLKARTIAILPPKW